MQAMISKYSEPIISFLSSFMSFLILCIINYYTFHGIRDSSAITFIPKDFPPTLIASFGASAVLIYGEYLGPLSQPRNLIVGHLIGAIIGVTIKQIFMYANADLLWLQGALAVSITIFLMEISQSVHPPGGNFTR